MGELIVNGIKWAFIIAVGATFMIAINALLTLLSAVVFGSVVGEVFGIISMCLPFDVVAVFGGIGTAIAAILAFMVAQKIYDLVSEHVKV